MGNNLEKYLLEAVGVEKEALALDNPYRKIGFDGNKPRLGWISLAAFSRIEECLKNLMLLLEGKKNFIYVGMGGSINGIKPLISLFKSRNLHILDNLDPRVVEELIPSINDFDKTLVISISKSGTTQETQLLSRTLQEIFSQRLGASKWQKNFLWLSDPSSFKNLDLLGWQEVAKTPIQFNSGTDIGGRFSSPHTCIFFLPLFLLLKKNFAQLKNIHRDFVSLQKAIRAEAYLKVNQCRDVQKAYFSPVIGELLGESFSAWIVQLFQESLGSKDPNLLVKTITNLKNNNQFFSLHLDLKIADKAVALMGQMYFFQVFIAYYCALKQINFVSQNFVEEYKQRLRHLEEALEQRPDINMLGISQIAEKIRTKIGRKQVFIEVVLYFYPTKELIKTIKNALEREFSDRRVLVFIGSDWNHQSYQAAFTAKDTFYVLLVSDVYLQSLAVVSKETLARNVTALKLIAQATYLTLKDKAIIAAISR